MGWNRKISFFWANLNCQEKLPGSETDTRRPDRSSSHNNSQKKHLTRAGQTAKLFDAGIRSMSSR